MGTDLERERVIADHVRAERFDAAASAILHGYGPPVLGYLRALIPRDTDTAIGLFGELLQAGLPRLAPETCALTWSYRIAWSVVQRLFEDPSHRGAPATDALLQEIRAVTPSSLKSETAAHLAALRTELDLEEQTVLVLRVDREMSWAEIALVVDGDESAASQARVRARYEGLVGRIRQHAKKRGVLQS